MSACDPRCKGGQVYEKKRRMDFERRWGGELIQRQEARRKREGVKKVESI